MTSDINPFMFLQHCVQLISFKVVVKTKYLQRFIPQNYVWHLNYIIKHPT